MDVELKVTLSAGYQQSRTPNSQPPTHAVAACKGCCAWQALLHRLAAAFGQDTIPRCAIHDAWLQFDVQACQAGGWQHKFQAKVWAEAADGTQLAEVWGSAAELNVPALQCPYCCG